MAALRRVSVTMYTTQWCPRCDEARDWMRQNNIAYVERDVEASQADERAMRALNPRGGVPTIDIDGQIVVGFGERRVARLIAESVSRRLNASRR